jgi:hypothetical protein
MPSVVDRNVVMRGIPVCTYVSAPLFKSTERKLSFKHHDNDRFLKPKYVAQFDKKFCQIIELLSTIFLHLPVEYFQTGYPYPRKFK